MIFDRREVDSAGEELKGDIPWNSYNEPSIVRLFAVANGWREAHLAPMRHIHLQLAAAIRRQQLNGVVASRLKRMPSIRRKLHKITVPLSKIQDLGGCRVILPSMNEVRAFSAGFQQSGVHHVRSVTDYIQNPKVGGYRSVHLMVSHRDERFEAYWDRRIELQLRSLLQHAWATAVEAVGLFRGEDLKGGNGSADWLRLFVLLAGEFAEAEGCAPVPGLPEQAARQAEIRDLDQSLMATDVLDRLSHAFRIVGYTVFDQYARYLLIRYDHARQEVAVETYSDASVSLAGYAQAERNPEAMRLDRQSDLDSVLVALDKVRNLQKAFPNYFGDVQLLRAQLQHICKGRGVADYLLPKQILLPPRPRDAIDLSWLRRPRFRRPRGS